MSDKSDKKHVKVLVHTPSKDGYPPEEWEGLWAVPVGEEKFKIDNIPFYAKNLSCDDIVEAKRDREGYIFQRLVAPSENSTIRIVVFDLADEGALRNDLGALGCSIEGTGTPGLIAVNVPKVCVEKVLDFLERAFADERLEFEEGALR